MTRGEVVRYILDKLLIAVIVAVVGSLLAAFFLSRLDIQEQAHLYIHDLQTEALSDRIGVSIRLDALNNSVISRGIVKRSEERLTVNSSSLSVMGFTR